MVQSLLYHHRRQAAWNLQKSETDLGENRLLENKTDDLIPNGRYESNRRRSTCGRGNIVRQRRCYSEGINLLRISDILFL